MMRHPLVVCVLSSIIAIALAPSAIAGRSLADSLSREVTQDAGVSREAQFQGVALVIGNADYPDQPLATPLNDAGSLAALLGAAGFEVIALENATRRDIERALVDFNRRLGKDGVGLFYFAGHGLQLTDSTLLLPIDALTDSAASARASGISLAAIIAEMSRQRPASPNLVIIDSCLNNPFAPPAATTAPERARLQVPDQTLLAFATSSGAVAYDGNGQHGLYTAELVKALAIPDLSLREIFARVRLAVSQRSAGKQIPWSVSSLQEDLHLVAAQSGSMRAQVTESPASPAMTLSMLSRGILPTDGEARYELEFWESVRNSTDAADYEAYLEAYPDGRFAPLARSRAERYKKTSAAAPEEPEPAVAEEPEPAVAEEPEPAVTEEPEKPALSIEGMDAEYEVVTNANVREKPSSRATQIGELSRGSTVQVTGRLLDRNWYRVETSAGITGYVYGELLREPAARPAPVATPRPAPKPVATPTVPAAQPAVTTARGEAARDCATCPEMVVLSAGSFTMGSSSGDRTEKPAHKVSIARPFAMGKYEVTLAQWNECLKAGACSHSPKKAGPSENSPVRDVSWSDTQEYVQWLSRITGQKYRLPTEAEWEYAARAGTQTRFWWGDAVGEAHADCKGCGGSWDHDTPADVDSLPANPFGLHGMNGGVWEWVSDCWHKSYSGAPTDGSAWDSSDCRQYVIRGGSWRNDPSYVHSASRFKYDANVRYLLNGFRVAKSLD